MGSGTKGLAGESGCAGAAGHQADSRNSRPRSRVMVRPSRGRPMARWLTPGGIRGGTLAVAKYRVAVERLDGWPGPDVGRSLEVTRGHDMPLPEVIQPTGLWLPSPEP